MSGDVEAIADAVAARLGLVAVGPLLKTTQVAEILGVTDRSVRKMVTSGVLPSLKVEGARRIETAALRRYLEECRGVVEVDG